MARRPVGFKVTGTRELRRQLKRAGIDAGDALKDGHRKTSDIVTDQVISSTVPRRSGELASSVRSAPTTTKAQVRAGSRGKPRQYAGVINYGWPGHGIEPAEYMEEGLRASWSRVETAYREFIDDFVQSLNRKR